jgi:hypothetical protein
VAKPKIESKRPKIRQQFDHHCDVCGYAGPHEMHACKGPKKISYVETRCGWCSRCSYSEDGICTLYKSLHPDRDAVIEIGIKMPFAACPAGLWNRVEYTCERCKSVTFLDSGVSRCKACGYSPKRVVNLPPKIIVKPEEPWTPVNPIAVVTLAVGQRALDILELTGPQMTKYADRCSADFHAITDDHHSNYALANKFRLRHLCANYDRVLFLDVDTWVRDTCPSLFCKLSPDSLWMHPDREFQKDRNSLDEIFAKVATQQQIWPTKDYHCLNTGVVLFGRKHLDMWTPPKLPAPNQFLTEQVWTEYNIRRDFALATSWQPLPRKYNHQWWMSDFAKKEPGAQIIHLAACPHEERLYRLRKLTKAGTVATT